MGDADMCYDEDVSLRVMKLVHGTDCIYLNRLLWFTIYLLVVYTHDLTFTAPVPASHLPSHIVICVISADIYPLR